MARGFCDVMLGRPNEGLEALEETTEENLLVGAVWVRGLHAVALNLAGRGDEGRQALEETMAIEACNGPHVRSLGRRLYGDLLAYLPEPDHTSAEVAYREAIEIAKGYDARSDELNATVGLARILRDTGRADEAREILAEVYGWFTEGHELPFLVEARELLEELEAPS
jgi:hypothetical protein